MRAHSSTVDFIEVMGQAVEETVTMAMEAALEAAKETEVEAKQAMTKALASAVEVAVGAAVNSVMNTPRPLSPVSEERQSLTVPSAPFAPLNVLRPNAVNCVLREPQMYQPGILKPFGEHPSCCRAPGVISPTPPLSVKSVMFCDSPKQAPCVDRQNELPYLLSSPSMVVGMMSQPQFKILSTEESLISSEAVFETAKEDETTDTSEEATELSEQEKGLSESDWSGPEVITECVTFTVTQKVKAISSEKLEELCRDRYDSLTPSIERKQSDMEAGCETETPSEVFAEPVQEIEPKQPAEEESDLRPERGLKPEGKPQSGLEPGPEAASAETPRQRPGNKVKTEHDPATVKAFKKMLEQVLVSLPTSDQELKLQPEQKMEKESEKRENHEMEDNSKRKSRHASRHKSLKEPLRSSKEGSPRSSQQASPQRSTVASPRGSKRNSQQIVSMGSTQESQCKSPRGSPIVSRTECQRVPSQESRRVSPRNLETETQQKVTKKSRENLKPKVPRGSSVLSGRDTSRETVSLASSRGSQVELRESKRASQFNAPTEPPVETKRKSPRGSRMASQQVSTPESQHDAPKRSPRKLKRKSPQESIVESSQASTTVSPQELQQLESEQKTQHETRRDSQRKSQEGTRQETNVSGDDLPYNFAALRSRFSSSIVQKKRSSQKSVRWDHNAAKYV